MKLGFLTACMHEEKLEDVVEWAKEAGFQALELAPWHVDAENLNEERVSQIKELFKRNNLEISSLGHHTNNLDPDEEKRKANHYHLKKIIEAAEMLEVELVSSFVGRDPYKDVEDNLTLYEKIFPELVDFAQDHKVKLIIENCPMETFPSGINLAYSPQIWQRMFEIIPSQNFGLNLDPSHLYWLGIDYLKVVDNFKERIFHVHAKDTEILKENLHKMSIRGRGWWRYRIPGLGEINWTGFISRLAEIGYQGIISIEHEDPVWSGSLDKVKKGLILGRRHLSPLII